MKKPVGVFLICVLLAMLIGCGVQGGGGASGEAPQAVDGQAVEEAAANIDYTTGTPWADIDLDGVVTADTPTDLKDNYALYVNKEAILDLEIPEGYPYGGTLMDVMLKQAEDVKNMFLGDAPDSHDAKLAYDLFWLMMDWDSRNAVGVAPLKEMTDAVEGISTIDELTAYYTETPYERLVLDLWESIMTEGIDDSSRYILAVGTSSLLLDNSAEYAELTPSGEVRKDAVTEFVLKMLVKLGYSDEEAQRKLDNCLQLEAMLAEVIKTSVEQQSSDYLASANNHYTRAELKEAQGDVPILEVFEKVQGYPESDDYLVAEPEFLQRLVELYAEENLDLIKDYLIVHAIYDNASLLDRESYGWKTKCANTINGSEGMLSDETAFSGSVSDMLSWPVARLYTETYLSQQDKDRISSMVDEILEEYHGIIEEADFLSDETRALAIEKLDAIEKNVLFPDSWEKYSCDELGFASKDEGGTLWDASLAILRYYQAERAKDYSEPVDKDYWPDTPQTVNCFYNPFSNQVYIMGAFAQDPIYNSDMSDEELYGKLGAVIGHEISHAFDSSGSQFDKDGNMASWWTDDDFAAFQARNEKMVAYYNAMHPWEGQDFNGEIMTGEACADMAGMKVILRIASEKEGFDYDAFFRAYADIFLTKDSLQMAYSRINDVHPMMYLRINATLQQYDEFLDYYLITEGDTMYLAPEDRVNIW